MFNAFKKVRSISRLNIERNDAVKQRNFFAAVRIQVRTLNRVTDVIIVQRKEHRSSKAEPNAPSDSV
jgi:hypothetical protein